MNDSARNSFVASHNSLVCKEYYLFHLNLLEPSYQSQSFIVRQISHILNTNTEFNIFLFVADIISCVEFNHDGELLATGDKAGRVVIFQRDQTVSCTFQCFPANVIFLVADM